MDINTVFLIESFTGAPVLPHFSKEESGSHGGGVNLPKPGSLGRLAPDRVHARSPYCAGRQLVPSSFSGMFQVTTSSKSAAFSFHLLIIETDWGSAQARLNKTLRRNRGWPYREWIFLSLNLISSSTQVLTQICQKISCPQQISSF